MPQVAAGAAFAGIGAFAAGATAVAIAQAVAFNLFLSAVLYATNETLASDKGASDPNFAAEAASRLVTSQSTIGAHRIVYGEVALGGQLVFQRMLGGKSEYLNQVIVLAAHEIDSVRTIYLDNEPIGQMNDFGTVVTGRYANALTIRVHLGGQDQEADAYLMSAFPGVWTSAHRLRGRAYIACTFTNIVGVYTGIPSIVCVVRGKKVYDPRSGLTGWSSNWALIIRDYLTAAWGLSAPGTEIDDVELIAAANVCDEQVSMAQYSVTIEPVRILPPPAPQAFLIIGPEAFPNGIYNYVVTFLDESGETTASPLSNNVFFTGQTVFNGGAQVYTIKTGRIGITVPLGPPGTIARKIYRGRGGVIIGTTVLALNVPPLGRQSFAITISDNTTTTWIDTNVNTVITDNRPFVVNPITPPPSVNGTGVIAFRTPVADRHIETGDGILLSGAVPSPFLAGTTYYWIRISDTDFSIAGTLLNAYAGIRIVPNHSALAFTVTQVSQPRYTINGTVFTGETPQNILEQMRSAGAGIIEYVSGKWLIRPGAYSSPVRVLTVDDLAGDIEVRARPPRSDLFNEVRGTYAEPSKDWQATDFPPVTNPLYVEQDGGLNLFRNIDLPFTANMTRAQRVAKITLERARQGIRVTFPAKLTAFKATVGDSLALTIAQMGWDEKVFSVQGWKFDPSGYINLDLQEESSASYAWNNGEAATIDYDPDTNLPVISSVHEPINLIAQSGSGILLVGSDGTITARILLTWNLSDDPYIAGYDFRWRQVGEDTYQTMRANDPTLISTYITGVHDGFAYEIGIRAFNVRGVTSIWTTIVHTVLGMTVLPGDVTGFAVAEQFIGTTAKIMWTLDTASLDYQVEVWAGSPSVKRRTQVRTSPDFIYTGDDALYDGGPWRDLTFKVRARNGFGYSANQAVLNMSNPAPAAPAVVLSSQALTVRVKIVSTPEVDVDGMRVWMATSPPALNALADVNLVYDGLELDKSIGGLLAGTTYYFRVAMFDHFGRTSLNASTASGATPSSVPAIGGIEVVAMLPFPVPAEGTVVYLNTDEKIYLSTGTQWITGTDASNISGTIVGSQIAAGTIGADKIAVANLAAINANLGDITAGTLTFNGAGYVKGGQTAFNAGTGFFLGFDAGAYKFSLGSPTAGLTWDGATLSILGNVITGGNIQAGSITASNILPNSITNASGETIDALIGLNATEQVLASSVSMTTLGGGVKVLIWENSTYAATGPGNATLRIYRGGTLVSSLPQVVVTQPGGGGTAISGAGTRSGIFVDLPPAGTFTYQLRAIGNNVVVSGRSIIALEARR